MCAINPKRKKRIIFDFYTSIDMPEDIFEQAILFVVTSAEQRINRRGDIRVHVKETKQEAE